MNGNSVPNNSAGWSLYKPQTNFILSHAQCVTATDFVVVSVLEKLHNRDGDAASPISIGPCIETSSTLHRKGGEVL